MKTKLTMSILSVSLASVMCGACGTDEELATTAASQERAPSGVESALSSPTSAPKPHCVATATAVPKDGTASLAASQAEPTPVTCFETFAEAAAFATKGRVSLPADARPEDLRSAMLSYSEAPYVVGVEYADRAFTGRSLTVTSSGTCTEGYVYMSPMPVERQQLWPWPYDWNDRISSAQAFSGCNHSYHFEDVNLGGAVIDCGTGCSYIGDALNDRTSSIQWTN